MLGPGDSTARVVAKAFIGDSRIEISPERRRRRRSSRRVIAFERDPDLTDIASGHGDVKPVLLSIKSLVEYLDDPQGDVKQAIAGITRCRRLNETRGRLDETVAQVGDRLEALAGNLEALSASLRGETLPRITSLLDDAGRTTRSADAFVSEDLRGIAASLREELVPQLRALIADADAAAAAAGSGIGRIDRELPAILDKVNATLENLKTVSGELVPAARRPPGAAQGGSSSRIRRRWCGTRKPGRFAPAGRNRGQPSMSTATRPATAVLAALLADPR
jgi:ABC-type transporter Mla subunit MlaD